jgi:hypothetical protein
MPRITSLADTDALLINISVSQYNIQTYDVDNAYPQRMQRLINACSVARQAVNILSKFTVGQGFDTEKSGDFYKQKVNSKGMTPDKLLRRTAMDKAEMRGFALHVNYNALFQIVSVNYVPFEHCRLGSGINEGKICVYPAWERRLFGKSIAYSDIKVIDRWNPDPVVISAQVKAAGGWNNYKGQVYWYSDYFEEYPVSSIGSVLTQVLGHIASAKTTTNNLKNNFALKMLYIEKGKFADEDERRDFQNNMQTFIGPTGLPLAIVDVESEEQIPELIKVDSALNDKLFEYSDSKIKKDIYQAFAQNGVLHSDMEGTGFNSQNLRDIYAAYNGYTNDERIIMEEVFGEIFSRFVRPINPSGDYTIKRLQYLDDITTTPAINGSTNQ